MRPAWSCGLADQSPWTVPQCCPPRQTTTYVLVATGAGGEVQGSVRVSVAAPPPTASLTADARTIDFGDSTTLRWSTTNASSVQLEGVGTVEASGSRRVTPTESVGYRLLVTGAGGTIEREVAVVVTAPAIPPLPIRVESVEPKPPAPPSLPTMSEVEAESVRFTGLLNSNARAELGELFGDNPESDDVQRLLDRMGTREFVAEALAAGNPTAFLVARRVGSEDSSTKLILVQNFFEELKRLVPN